MGSAKEGGRDIGRTFRNPEMGRPRDDRDRDGNRNGGRGGGNGMREEMNQGDRGRGGYGGRQQAAFGPPGGRARSPTRGGGRDNQYGPNGFNGGDMRGGNSYGPGPMAGKDREQGQNKVYEDRGGNRGVDRGADRGGDRGGDRGIDRAADRGGDRGVDKGGERGGDRGGNRGVVRNRSPSPVRRRYNIRFSLVLLTFSVLSICSICQCFIV